MLLKLLPQYPGKKSIGLHNQTTGQLLRLEVFGFFLSLLFIIGTITSCKKNELHNLLNEYEQTNLIADVDGFGAPLLDPNLVNAWGIAVAPSGPIWISANNGGVSTIYSPNGTILRPPVTIPAPDGSPGGTPTGVVFNATADFIIDKDKSNTPSKFIFATEDGTIAAWGAGNLAVIMSDQSPTGAVYKGLAMATNSGMNYLYATNFNAGKIDVFDAHYNLASGMSFTDPAIPSGFAPFNIRNIGGLLYVTYAMQDGDKHDDVKGPGNGFIDVFRPDGSWVKRFATRGALNSPWGLAEGGSAFGDGDENVILVGNFGDGHINVFNLNGIFLGALKDENHPIAIEGLWAIETNVPTADPKKLFFTAGPVDESHGIFGYLLKSH